jgi:hypothetical protein|tara:strand:- start:12121 stop:12249 length:129 start_codon:yes stop_codon:yes gene_type:complete
LISGELERSRLTSGELSGSRLIRFFELARAELHAAQLYFPFP